MEELQPIKATPALEGSVGQLLYYFYQLSVSNLSLYTKAVESIQNSPFSELRKPLTVILDHALAQIEHVYVLWSPQQKSPIIEDPSFKSFCKHFFEKYTRVAIVEKKSTLWVPLERQIHLIELCESTAHRCLLRLSEHQPELREELDKIAKDIHDRMNHLGKFKSVLKAKVLQAKESYAEPKPFL